MKDQNYLDDELNKAKEKSSVPSTEKINRIKGLFRDCPDFVLKKILLPHGKTGHCLFLETLVSPKEVRQHLIEPLLALDPAGASITKLNHHLIPGILIHNPGDEALANAISSGSVILMLEGEEPVLSVRL